MSAPDPETVPPSFTCPRCRRTSFHPMDVLNGYCGNCHDWTGSPTPDLERNDGHQ